MQIKIFIHFSHTIWFPGTNICRKQMLKKMRKSISLHPLTEWKQQQVTYVAGQQQYDSDFKQPEEEHLGKILSDPFEHRIHKTEPEKYWRRRKDGLGQNKPLTPNPSRQVFPLQLKGFWIRPLQVGLVSKAHAFGDIIPQSNLGVWAVTALQEQALQSIKYKV